MNHVMINKDMINKDKDKLNEKALLHKRLAHMEDFELPNAQRGIPKEETQCHAQFI